ncbi:MAG: hypothetical protein GOMPHAMPRED_006611 [Gomphillus americanus]|uniref:NAD-dependent epimerase/dehydratase domain-containing protein n=1 Tax=Gomphillus americanus TaxID=1940652 RepID=A0A8H3IXK8_9LECA|nr:MAG: hypothetical protein GOMPHAMPRED_006611 [Gomphillus americanus]
MSSSPKLAIPKGSLVLVTGSTGYIGSWVVYEFIKQGYRVRASVRSQEKFNNLSSIIEKAFGPGKVEASFVTDFSSPDGYADAIKGVDAVVHVATDTSFSSDPDVVVKNAVDSTKGLLNLARKTPSVKRVVLTSSSVALAFHDPTSTFKFSDKAWNDSSVEQMHSANSGYVTYAASKVLGEKAFWEGDASFVRNTVLPSFTIGPALDDTLSSSTHAWLKGTWNNEEVSVATLKMIGPYQWFINVQDIAKLHVGAVIFEEVANQRLLGLAGKYSFNDAIDFFHKVDPERSLPSKFEDVPEDTTEADTASALEVLKLFGQNGFIGVEQTIKENIA